MFDKLAFMFVAVPSAVFGQPENVHKLEILPPQLITNQPNKQIKFLFPGMKYEISQLYVLNNKRRLVNRLFFFNIIFSYYIEFFHISLKFQKTSKQLSQWSILPVDTRLGRAERTTGLGQGAFGGAGRRT